MKTCSTTSCKPQSFHRVTGQVETEVHNIAGLCTASKLTGEIAVSSSSSPAPLGCRQPRQPRGWPTPALRSHTPGLSALCPVRQSPTLLPCSTAVQGVDLAYFGGYRCFPDILLCPSLFFGGGSL